MYLPLSMRGRAEARRQLWRDGAWQGAGIAALTEELAPKKNAIPPRVHISHEVLDDVSVGAATVEATLARPKHYLPKFLLADHLRAM